MSATAVRSEPINEELQNLMATYKPPSHAIGTQVRFYPGGVRQDGRAMVGTIVKTNGRTCTVQLVDGSYKSAVRYVDDPRLSQGDEIRAMGAWDFTEDTLFLVSVRQRMEALEKQVAELLSELGSPKKQPPLKG